MRPDVLARDVPQTDAAVKRITEAMIACTLPEPAWTHAAHWAAALWIVARKPELHAPDAMPVFIRRYNESLGHQNTETSGYHETITQASLRAARHHLSEVGPDAPVSQTLHNLLATPLGRSGWLLKHWSKPRLFSPEARRAWVEPDVLPLPFPEFPPKA